MSRVCPAAKTPRTCQASQERYVERGFRNQNTRSACSRRRYRSGVPYTCEMETICCSRSATFAGGQKARTGNWFVRFKVGVKSVTGTFVLSQELPFRSSTFDSGDGEDDIQDSAGRDFAWS